MFTVMMKYFEPITDVLNKNCPHKRIVHTLKHTSRYSHIFVSNVVWQVKGASYRYQQSKKRQLTVTRLSEHLRNPP